MVRFPDSDSSRAHPFVPTTAPPAAQANSALTGSMATPAASTAFKSLASLCALGQWLAEQEYQFICPTPETQARINARCANDEARCLRDVFGWSRPFRESILPRMALEWLREAAALEEADGVLRSRVRYSTIGRRVFVHSAFPTEARDAVFFGPDSYRFIAFVRQMLQYPWPHAVRSLADIGCGSGAGAIAVSDKLDPAELNRIVLCDINPLALGLASVNTRINDLRGVDFTLSDGLSATQEMFDLIITNPPYMVDRRNRTYCHGGTNWGVEVAMRFLAEALARLAPGGRLALYTGTPIIHGRDLFQLASLPLLESARFKYHYREIDPDVFGEDLSLPEYESVERIAVVGLSVFRPGQLQ